MGAMMNAGVRNHGACATLSCFCVCVFNVMLHAGVCDQYPGYNVRRDVNQAGFDLGTVSPADSVKTMYMCNNDIRCKGWNQNGQYKSSASTLTQSYGTCFYTKRRLRRHNLAQRAMISSGVLCVKTPCCCQGHCISPRCQGLLHTSCSNKLAPRTAYYTHGTLKHT